MSKRATEPPSISGPIDELHEACLDARHSIRAHAKVLAGHAAAWTPRPMPPGWYPEPRQERNE